MRVVDIYYYEGEKPPELIVNYEDEDGVLDASIAGASFVAKTSIDGAANVDVPVSDKGDGSVGVTWPTGTSRFILAGTTDGLIAVLIQVTQGSNVWHLPLWSCPVKKLPY